MNRPKVLIGPLFVGQAESVSIVNNAFVDGLSARIEFMPHTITRRFGVQRSARLNTLNLFYLQKQVWQWGGRLVCFRPALAHYAIGSFWNLEKGLFLLKMARLLGARTLGHLHSGAFIEFWKQLSPLRKKKALAELRRLDGFVVLSEGWKQIVIQEVGLEPSRVFVVNNPIEREFEDAALQFPIATRGSPVVFALGVMEKAKGVFDLLDAVRRVADQRPVRLILAGQERAPNVYRQVNERISELNLQAQVTVLGEVRGAEKLELFRQSAVFVLPSYTENFPLVILEAAAAGLGIVTTPVGATPEFFQHGHSALFVKPGDVPALAEAIGDLLQHETKRQELARAARAVFVEQLSRTRVMDSMYAAYLSVLQK